VQAIRTSIAALVATAGLSCAQTISVDQLLHRVPASARREYSAAGKALGTGDLLQSIAHCRRAIEADPDNASAHNDLGVLYLSDGRPEEAMPEFNRAVALQPRLTVALVNASFAALALGRYQDAEPFARSALDTNRSHRHAHLLLGWSLVAQHEYSGEALESLRIAEREFPEAHLAAADVLVHQGSLDAARAQVEAYLASGSTEHKSLAETWLQFLTLR
jgi:tetratricopeptide (TPR) repeat protein